MAKGCSLPPYYFQYSLNNVLLKEVAGKKREILFADDFVGANNSVERYFVGVTESKERLQKLIRCCTI